MAKMFYSLEEVQAKLSCDHEQVKQYVNDGKLREFRDGAKVMFKVDEVDTFHPDAAVDDGLNLSPLSDTDLTSPAPSEEAGSGSGVTDASNLVDSGELEMDMATPLDESSELGLASLGDSADQISLEDSDPKGEKADKDDTVITSHGVNVLDDSDENFEMVDPMAQTQMAPDFADQVTLDSGASGSGLLDLTREADDTSLGAELLEEIYPGGDEGAIETQIPGGLEVPEQSMTQGSMTNDQIIQPEPVVQYTQATGAIDQASGAFGVAMVITFLVLIYMTLVVAGAVAGVRPAMLESLSTTIVNWSVMGGAAGLALIIALIGSAMSGRPARPPKEKTNKPKKAKKQKKK